MSLFNLWEEGKYFTELIGSEANDSVETFNSFLASQTVRLEKQSCCVFIQQQEPGVVILRKRIHWTTEKGKKELKQGKAITLFSNLEVMMMRPMSNYC